jgi:hypothetical protein
MRRLFRLWRLSGQDLRILIAAARNPNRPRWLLPALIALAGLLPVLLTPPSA